MQNGKPTEYTDGWSFYQTQDFQLWEVETGNAPFPKPSAPPQVRLPVSEGARGNDICMSGGSDALCDWRGLQNLEYPAAQGANSFNMAQNLDMLCAVYNWQTLFMQNKSSEILLDKEETTFPPLFSMEIYAYIFNYYFVTQPPAVISQKQVFYDPSTLPGATLLGNPIKYNNYLVYLAYGEVYNWISASYACPNWKSTSTKESWDAYNIELSLHVARLAQEPPVTTLDRTPAPAPPPAPAPAPAPQQGNPRFTPTVSKWKYSKPRPQGYYTATAQGYIAQDPFPYYTGSVPPAPTKGTKYPPDPGCPANRPYLLQYEGGNSYYCYQDPTVTTSTPVCACACTGLGPNGQGFCNQNQHPCESATPCGVDQVGFVPTDSKIKVGTHRGMATASTPISITPTQDVCSQNSNAESCIDRRCVWWEPDTSPANVQGACGNAPPPSNAKASEQYLNCAAQLQDAPACEACTVDRYMTLEYFNELGYSISNVYQEMGCVNGDFKNNTPNSIWLNNPGWQNHQLVDIIGDAYNYCADAKAGLSINGTTKSYAEACCGSATCANNLQCKTTNMAVYKKPQCVACSGKLSPQACNTPQVNTSLAACAWDHVHNLCVHVPLWRKATQKGGLFPVQIGSFGVLAPGYSYDSNVPLDRQSMNDPNTPRLINPAVGLGSPGLEYFNPASNTRFNNSEQYSPYTLAAQTMPFMYLPPSSGEEEQEVFSRYDESACTSATCGSDPYQFAHHFFDSSDTIAEFKEKGGRLNELWIYCGCAASEQALWKNEDAGWSNLVVNGNKFSDQMTISDFCTLMSRQALFENIIAAGDNFNCGFLPTYLQGFKDLWQPGCLLSVGIGCALSVQYASPLRGFARVALGRDDKVSLFTDGHRGTLADIYIDTGCVYGAVGAYKNEQFNFAPTATLGNVFDAAYALCTDRSRRVLCCRSIDCEPACVKLAQAIPYAHPILYGGLGAVDTAARVCAPGYTLTWVGSNPVCVATGDAGTPFASSTAVYARSNSYAAFRGGGPVTWRSRDGLQELRAQDAPSPSNILAVPGADANTLTFVKGEALMSLPAGPPAPDASTMMPCKFDDFPSIVVMGYVATYGECWHTCSINAACSVCFQSVVEGEGSVWKYGYRGGNYQAFDGYCELPTFNISQLKSQGSAFAPLIGNANFTDKITAPTRQECNRVSPYRLWGFDKSTCYVKPTIASTPYNVTAFRQVDAPKKDFCDLTTSSPCGDTYPYLFNNSLYVSGVQESYLVLGNASQPFISGARYLPLFSTTWPSPSAVDNTTLYFEDLQICGYFQGGFWNELPKPCASCTIDVCVPLDTNAYNYYVNNILLTKQNAQLSTQTVERKKINTQSCQSNPQCNCQPCSLQIPFMYKAQTLGSADNCLFFNDLESYNAAQTNRCIVAETSATLVLTYTRPLKVNTQFFLSLSTDLNAPTLSTLQDAYGDLTYTYAGYGYSNGVACQCQGCPDSVGVEFMAMLPLPRNQSTLPDCDRLRLAGFVNARTFTVAGLYESAASKTMPSLRLCVDNCWGKQALRYSGAYECTCYDNPDGYVNYYALTTQPAADCSDCDRRAGCSRVVDTCVNTKTPGDLEMPLPKFINSTAQMVSSSVPRAAKTDIYWQLPVTLQDATGKTFNAGSVPSNLVTQQCQPVVLSNAACKQNYPMPAIAIGGAPTHFEAKPSA